MRYTRQIALPELGEVGQQRLSETTVAVVGVGGLGCPALQYLAAAGIGKLILVDGDRVELSNLHRQVLFSAADVGRWKVEAAKDRLQAMNPEVNIATHNCDLNASNALDILSPADIVIDATDRIHARYVINDACVQLNKPFVYGAIHRFQGQLSVFNHQNGPTYRCLFPESKEPVTIPNCDETGVLGVLPGTIGTLQAAEALKIALKIGKTLSGTLKILNVLEGTEMNLSFDRDEQQIIIALSRTLQPIGLGDPWHAPQNIQADELMRWMHSGREFTLIDVREWHEQPKLATVSSINIPLGQLQHRMAEIPTSLPVVVMCQHGIRSQIAIDLMREFDIRANLYNLSGGIVTLPMQ